MCNSGMKIEKSNDAPVWQRSLERRRLDIDPLFSHQIDVKSTSTSATHCFMGIHLLLLSFTEVTTYHLLAVDRINVDVHEHDDVIKWKHFPRYWPFVRGIHRSPVNSPHKGQWRRAVMFSLICVLINVWVNNREAGDLRRYRAHYDIIVMIRTVLHTHLQQIRSI